MRWRIVLDLFQVPCGFDIIRGMQCRTCGTEIADKAIVCYRCGTGTTDPVRKAAPIKPRRSPWPSLAGGVAPLLLALYLLMAADTSAHPSEMTASAAVLAAVGVLILIVSLVRRR